MTMDPGKAGRPCVFFDRDGVVNQSPGPGYVERVTDFHLLPAFLDALRVSRERGYEAVIVTNQRGVGLGLMTQDTLDEIHASLRDALDRAGLDLLDIYCCTADDNAHPHRKPNPGMLLAAAEEHGLDLSRSWMVGDNEKDVLAGRAAGCRTVLIHASGATSVADHRLSDMAELAGFLKKVL